MPSNKPPISTVLLLSTAVLLTACAPKVSAPSLRLTDGDRTPAADPPRPAFTPLGPPAEDGASERTRLLDAVIKPLLDFSLAQEATTAAERQRADGVVAKVDALNRATTPKRRKILGVF